MIKVIEPAKIKTKPLFFQLNDPASTDLFMQSFNYVPFLFIWKIDDPTISGATIDPRDVIYVKLFNSKFLPEIELYCNDSKGILFNDLYPFDHDTIISIFVKSYSEVIMPIRMDFRVTEYETVKTDGRRNVFKYLIKGILDVDDLHFSNYEVVKDTSYELIKKLALRMKLGFASNVTSSNDSMKWINPATTIKKWIKEITEYSWISADSFVWTFIDFYYNLNYVNIQEELNEFNIDQIPLSNPEVIKNDKEDIAQLYLTNNSAFAMTNRYISTFNLVNQSFKVNLDIFYKMKGTWYSKTENTVYKKYVKELITDDTKLKSGEGTLNQLIDKKHEIYCQNINDEYFIGKFDIDNVHENYAFAKISNKFNLDRLEKMKMIVTLNQINLSIKRFQTILVQIFNPDDLFSQDAKTKTPLNNINKKLSGYWYVTGINYLYQSSGGVEQEVTLMRRDLSVNYGQGGITNLDFRKYIS